MPFVRFALGSAIVLTVLTGVWGAEKPVANPSLLPGEELTPLAADSDSLHYPFHD